ncbi:class I SAM-dependent methyltransferase [Massilia glaciei]|nr:rRNA adenine N-6-methyltransferase family protein [Massilia glaciei]
MFRYLISRMGRAGGRGATGAAARVPAWLFLREFLRNPGAMGALCPSSERLAARIAHQVDLSQEGWIVELGAGTGAVTEALLRHGVRPERLIVIERSRYLVRHLRSRFPQVRVILGDACDGSALIEDCVPLAAVVSGLPLRSLSAEQVARVTRAWCAGIGPEVKVIQFTYAPRGASAWSDAGLTWRTDETVWGNLPPARVEVFTR